MQERTNTEMPHQDYLNEFEAAIFTRFSVGTLRNMRSAKRGPRYLKVSGRTIRYMKSDLEVWMGSEPVLTRDSISERGDNRC